MNISVFKSQLRKEFREKVADKKIIVWGTGGLYRKLKDFFEINVKEDVLFFVESAGEKESFEGKNVINADGFLSQFPINKHAIVLVCTSAWNSIKKVICTDVLNSDLFYVPYEDFSWVIDWEETPILSTNKDIQNLLLNTNMIISEKKVSSIAIMVGERVGQPHPYYFITLGVLLRLKGMYVEFLFNDLSNDGDLSKGAGFTKIQNILIENLLSKVSEKYGIEFEKISEQRAIELSEEEKRNIHQYIYYNQVWYSRNVILDKNDEKLNIRKSQWLENAKLIKGFLQKNNFEKVYTWTGVHGDWASLYVLAKSLKIKVYSSEYIRSGYSYSIEGPTIYQRDIKLVATNLNETQENKLLRIAETHIETYFSQKTEDKLNKPLVVIPLNVFWDSASFSDEDCFIYFDEWLLETINFLINKCKVNVYVRQHPYERRFGTGKDLAELLISSFGHSPLFRFIEADSDFSTYSIIKNAQLVLPNTSTVGIEAAMIGKQVIVKNNVYYSDSGFVKKANSKDEYFTLIKKGLSTNKSLKNKEIEKAKVYFVLTMLNETSSTFGHWFKDVHVWSKSTLDVLLKEKPVKQLLDSIINNQYLLISRLEEGIYDENFNNRC
ncbi:hypothetical protein KDN24_14695 [Bacillus sp. Bva_UNVM-123]|uniref:hypothetical protein n=1 Tax=Bacillus sp. Bva_UNVM-123 TaxID=2829798 RepID=UPI00391F042F